MIYIPGKGTHHLVPLLVPSDCVEAMEKVVHEDTRKNAEVAVDNDSVFASTKQSELNMCGWHALKDVCANTNLNKPDFINATITDIELVPFMQHPISLKKTENYFIIIWDTVVT